MNSSIIDACKPFDQYIGKKFYEIYAYYEPQTQEGITGISEHSIVGFCRFGGELNVVVPECNREPTYCGECNSIPVDDFGKSLFWTEEEAKKEIAKMESIISENSDFLYRFFGREQKA